MTSAQSQSCWTGCSAAKHSVRYPHTAEGLSSWRNPIANAGTPGSQSQGCQWAVMLLLFLVFISFFLGESPFFWMLSVSSCSTQLRGTVGVFTA